jgi:hypothetical protein
MDDADGEIDAEEPSIEVNEIATKTRFELMSAMLWHVMQKQLYQPDTARRLKGLTQGIEVTNEPDEDDEELFPQTSAESTKRTLNNFAFDDDEEDMMDFENFDYDFDDEFLFESDNRLKDDVNGDEEEDLFRRHDTTIVLDEDDLLL